MGKEPRESDHGTPTKAAGRPSVNGGTRALAHEEDAKEAPGIGAAGLSTGLASEPRSLTRLAVARGTAAFVMLATATVAVLTFTLGLRMRLTELDQYYSRAVARESEHFALRFENDRQVVDSVTQGAAPNLVPRGDEAGSVPRGEAAVMLPSYQGGCQNARDRELCEATQIAKGNGILENVLKMEVCPEGMRWGQPIVQEQGGKPTLIFLRRFRATTPPRHRAFAVPLPSSTSSAPPRRPKPGAPRFRARRTWTTSCFSRTTVRSRWATEAWD